MNRDNSPIILKSQDKSKQKNTSKVFASKIINPQCLDRIKDVSIIDVISNKVKLKRQGHRAIGLCPFHNEKTASFNVDENKGIYKCFGCGRSGDAIQFIRELENKNFIESCTAIAEIVGIQIEYKEELLTDVEIEKLTAAQSQEEVLNHTVKFYNKNLVELPKDHPVKKYLHGRGISDEIISEWQIGWAGTEWHFITPELINKNWFEPANKLGIIKHSTKSDKNYDGYRSRITIPIADKNGKYIGVAGRYIEIDPADKDKRFPKYINTSACELYDKSATLFALNRGSKSIKEEGHAVIVEGYFDVISLQKIGIENVVGVCGTSFTDAQMLLLKRFTSHIKMMLDNDDAGFESFEKSLPPLLEHDFKVDVIEYDNKFKDPDAIIIALGKEALSNTKTTDAIQYMAKNLLENVMDDPHKFDNAIKEISKLICCLDSETLRASYIDIIQKDLKRKGGLLAKQVKADWAEKERRNQEEISKTKSKEKSSEEVDTFSDAKNFITRKDGVFVSKLKGKSITNFDMKIVYQTKTNTEKAYRLIVIKNTHGVEKSLFVDTDELVGLGSFKKILARAGNFIFRGKDDDWSLLQEFLQMDETNCDLIEQMGWDKKNKFYAFCNGIVPCDENNDNFLQVDNYGIVEHNGKHFFIPGKSSIFSDKEGMYQAEKKFLYREPRPNFGFKEWANLFFEVYGDKAIAAISFYFSALFRDIIYKQFERFPILNLYGPPTFGKGSLMESIMSMFGEKQTPIMLGAGSTPVGMQRKMAFLINALVSVDEYKNDLDKKVIESIKSFYDGQTRTTGMMTNDFQTQNTSVKSGIILAGEDIPIASDALFTRVIFLSFDEGKFTNEGRLMLSRLKEMESDGGFSDITVSLLKYRPLIESTFKKTYDIISARVYKEITGSDIKDRMVLNISILLTMLSILKDRIDLPFSYEEGQSFLINNMKNQHAILIGNDVTSRFWDVVENLAAQKLILYGKDYFIKDSFLFIRLKNVHPLYLKEMRQRGSSHSLSSVESLRHYLKMNKQSYIKQDKQRFPEDVTAKNSVTCDRFNLSETKVELSGHDKSEDLKYEVKDNEVEKRVEDDEELPF